MSMGSADGENHYGSRSLLRDTGIGSRSRVNLGAHTDVSRPGYLAVHSEDSVIGRSPAVVYREDRVRERRNSDDSFFYSRRLFDDSQETSSTTSPGLSLPPTPRQSRQLFYQAAYQLQQQLEEDAQGCPRVCDYELERRERSRSSSTIGSHSAEGKTSAETTERDVSIDKIGEILQNGLEKSLDDENFNGDQHFQPQQYVYDEREGQYILR